MGFMSGIEGFRVGVDARFGAEGSDWLAGGGVR